MTNTKHSWINFPNNGRRKCTKCGCTKKTITRDKRTVTIYEKNGVISESFIECVDNIIYQNR